MLHLDIIRKSTSGFVVLSLRLLFCTPFSVYGLGAGMSAIQSLTLSLPSQTCLFASYGISSNSLCIS